ncbi:MAG: phenylalanine--tRNA ligase subunit alpha [Bacteroidetes bacterium 4484_276]|nr:MAG: phenylalanine--tRNA ligase subunit alpha [Bacteroidetes bacterium 4484_276]
MKEKIREILNSIENFKTGSVEELDNFRIKYLSKKGIIPALFGEFKNVAPDERKEMGKVLNELKNKAQEKLKLIRQEIDNNTSSGKQQDVDLTMPVDFMDLGSRHPLTIVRRQILEIFARIGFTVSEGPEIENDWHNFSALNFIEEHPARDMQDTFFIDDKDDKVVLRTHTSSVQVRVMKNQQPPIRTISPGRVFRNEAISARAHCIFHQVEGLYVDHNVSFADLKQALYYFAREFFGEKTEIRFRPSYFPFTEPSAEMDISCNICGGKGCNICKYSGWVEILGCGMVDPQVLENCNINSREYTGYAFGMGIERIAMLKYQVNDLRLFFENDLRFLKQFQSAF